MCIRDRDISDEGIEYLTAEEEEDKIIAQGNACLLYTSILSTTLLKKEKEVLLSILLT